MLNITLSAIARVGGVAATVYVFWPQLTLLRDHALSGNLTLSEWMAVAIFLLFAIAFALVLIIVALFIAFCVVSAAVRALKTHLALTLRDAASLPCGR
ncbi:hypothetical protein [Erwinia amylovora]|uniref:hypothetical protein n=2 Tax=Erwinia amylovora TaxID=552 RepID=UPI000C07B30F|nr:hypothetical protein [Erwinia amylovora]